MINTQSIQQAASQQELNDLIERAAYDRNCEVDESMTYLEQADFLRQEAERDQGNGYGKMIELAEILEAAETKWFELGK